MKELIEDIAKALVSNPEEVKVTEEQKSDNGPVILRLEVAPEDKGRVIGRQGRVAQSMRVLLRIAAVKSNTRIILEIE